MWTSGVMLDMKSKTPETPRCSRALTTPTPALLLNLTTHDKSLQSRATCQCIVFVHGRYSSSCTYDLVKFRHHQKLTFFRTNASPLYVFLFLAATYIFERPCAYCSILLFVLIASVFDFHGDWFEPRWPLALSTESVKETLSSFVSANATNTDLMLETASLAFSAINGTSGTLASAALDGVRRRAGGGAMSVGATGVGFEWLRGVIEKMQLRIPCLDVSISL